MDVTATTDARDHAAHRGHGTFTVGNDGRVLTRVSVEQLRGREPSLLDELEDGEGQAHD
jgi:hypothetical protein